MAVITSKSINFDRGFWPNAGLVGPTRIPDSARDGLNILFLEPGVVKSAKGLGAGPPFNAGGERLYLVDDRIGVVRGKGSVVPFRESALYYISDGAIFVEGTTVSASGSAGRLKYLLNGQTYNAGLEAPAKLENPAINGAATVKIEEGSAGVNKGTYSIVITKKRSFSAEESNGSPPSDIISVSGKKIKLTMPPVPAANDPDTFDQWSIYGTFMNQGSVGPYFFLKDVPATQGSSGQVIEVEWQNKDLKQLQPPVDHNIPPTGQYVVPIGGYMVIIGSFGGNGISPSLPTDPGSYPVLSTTFLNPLEQVIGFIARQQEGELLLWTKNSLQSLVLTGASTQPILPRAIWPLTGIQGKHGACFADSQFYAFTSDSGPVRLSSNADPDTSFALPVREYFRKNGWVAANVVVGYDPVYDMVVYMHGNIAVPYMRSLDIWSCPVQLNTSGTVKAAITFQGRLYISMDDVLFGWEAGAANPDWYVIPAWQDEPQSFDRKTIIGFRCVVDAASFSGQLHIDFDSNNVPPNGLLTDSGTGNRYTIWQRTNVQCRSYTIKLSGTNPDEYVYNTEVRMIYTPNVMDKK